MHKIFTPLFILALPALLYSQKDTSSIEIVKKNKYVIWFIPSAAPNIYGIALGPVGSEAICNPSYTKQSHGLNIQIIGQGILQVFYINKVKFKHFITSDNTYLIASDSVERKAVHNGLLLSPFGTFTDQINGVSLSLWMSMGRTVNGVSINLLWNLYEHINGLSIGLVNHAGSSKGMQIGLINKTKKLRGVQIGLWNKNEKRSLPFVNWNFK